MSSPDRLVYMANQIGKFFESQGHEKAVPAIADHIKKFWDPRMRKRDLRASRRRRRRPRSERARSSQLVEADLSASSRPRTLSKSHDYPAAVSDARRSWMSARNLLRGSPASAHTILSPQTMRRQMTRKKLEGIEDYKGAAAGWGALKAVADAVRGQMAPGKETHGLLTMNQPHGFDCPGCAWPDPKHTSSFEFCENGAKAVTWEATAKRTTPEFFASPHRQRTLELADYELENEGRLTHPMVYDRATDRYLPISWDEAFGQIGAALRALPDPEHGGVLHLGPGLERGRLPVSVVRARIRHQQLSRLLEHVPRGHQRRPAEVDRRRQGNGDAGGLRPQRLHLLHRPQSRHQPSAHADDAARGLQARRADHCRSIRCGSAALERFTSPQNPVEMVTLGSTPIASSYYQVKVGGDVAVLKGMMKTLLALDARSLAAGGAGATRPRVHRRPYDRLRGLAGGSRRDVLGRDRGGVAVCSRSDIEAVAQRLRQGRTASSSTTAWASPSIGTAPATCSRSPIC